MSRGSGSRGSGSRGSENHGSDHPFFEIPDAKLVDYLLNPDHPNGGPKARFFLAFGFDARHPVVFAQALAAVHGSPDSRTRELDVGGRRRLVVDGPIEAPDGR